MSTYTMAAVQARTLAGEEMVLGGVAGRRGQAGLHDTRPGGRRRAISLNFPGSTSSRTRSRRPSRPVAPSCSSLPHRHCLAPSRGARAHDGGLPPGWLNVLVGPSSEIGDVLVEDDRVALITFTGSSGVGWGIRERALRKRVNLGASATRHR